MFRRNRKQFKTPERKSRGVWQPGTAGLHPHFTFFHSIGKEQGMMLAVTFERLCIQTPAEVVCIDNPVFAFSFETSAFGKEYEVLLNSRLL